MKAFLTFENGGSRVGTLHLELHDKIVPKTVRNFATFLSSDHKGYVGSRVHRLIPGFMLQAGDFTDGDGTGGYSVYGKTFADENFIGQHDRPGVLSMANAGPNTNGSQFFVTFKPTPHLDGKHVVFGNVDLEKSADCLAALEQIRTGASDKPSQALTIVDCGVLSTDEEAKPAATSTVEESAKDEDEIDLEDADEDGDPKEDNPALDEEEEEEVDDSQPVSKAEALKRRLRKLKQKMNQARQLNKQAVKQEGERSNDQGAAKERKRLAFATKEAKKASWEKQNAKAFANASKSGVDAKHLTEQAVDSVHKARITADKDELYKYNVNDYHNPEGQHRHYLRDLKSLSRNPQGNASTATYDPLQNEANPEQERQGARKLAEEMHRRIEKVQRRQLKRKDEDDGDVSYINQRNKKFNEKIKRTYDNATSEIRENLERGTAL
jgi:cyclophilin family peptidyl-prolyl cis-trans isomerase